MIDNVSPRNLPGTPVTDASEIFAMNWRFFPTLDPQVDLYLCRDLDSRITSREVAATTEWIHSGQVTILRCDWSGRRDTELLLAAGDPLDAGPPCAQHAAAGGLLGRQARPGADQREAQVGPRLGQVTRGIPRTPAFNASESRRRPCYGLLLVTFVWTSV